MRRWATFSVGILLVMIGSGGSTCARWDRADEFVRGLRCGMTEAQIIRYAESFEGVEVTHPDSTNLPPLVLNHDSTRVRCWFEEEGLRWVQVAWISSPMKLTEGDRIDLCASEKRQRRELQEGLDR
jgi:hypothetical protein